MPLELRTHLHVGSMIRIPTMCPNTSGSFVLAENGRIKHVDVLKF